MGPLRRGPYSSSYRKVQEKRRSPRYAEMGREPTEEEKLEKLLEERNQELPANIIIHEYNQRTNTFAPVRVKRKLSESERLEKLLEERNQELPAKIEKLRGEKPEKALDTIKVLEKKAKSIIDKLEVRAENFERVKEYLNYFENCGIYSNELKQNVNKKISSIMNTYKNKMKNLKRFREEMGT